MFVKKLVVFCWIISLITGTLFLLFFREKTITIIIFLECIVSTFVLGTYLTLHPNTDSDDDDSHGD